ncbi:MAG: hypothetical protein H0T17_00175 [Propionibacteriales bacterium]|nr:hypothetical protein [Propionibacteriales bacterium]
MRKNLTSYVAAYVALAGTGGAPAHRRQSPRPGTRAEVPIEVLAQLH